MKKIKSTLLICLTLILISCSSDSEETNSVTNELSINGNIIPISSVVAQKSEETISISATSTDGSSIYILFNKYGNIEYINYNDENFISYYNYKYFKSNYFDFDLVSLSESNNNVKVSFSGDLYEDDLDLNSNNISISGSFDVDYINQTPLISGLGLNCKIAGQNWYVTEFWDNGFLDIDRKFISDDDKMLIMNFANYDILPGTYSFNENSANKLNLARFNTSTYEYENYSSSGSFTITSNTISGSLRIIEGTFNFTATLGSNTVQVTQGRFKTNF